MTTISILPDADLERPIMGIKAIRTVTDLGLKDAKTVIDAVRGSGGWDSLAGKHRKVTPVASQITLKAGQDSTAAREILKDAGLMLESANPMSPTASLLIVASLLSDYTFEESIEILSHSLSALKQAC